MLKDRGRNECATLKQRTYRYEVPWDWARVRWQKRLSPSQATGAEESPGPVQPKFLAHKIMSYNNILIVLSHYILRSIDVQQTGPFEEPLKAALRDAVSVQYLQTQRTWGQIETGPIALLPLIFPSPKTGRGSELAQREWTQPLPELRLSHQQQAVSVLVTSYWQL